MNKLFIVLIILFFLSLLTFIYVITHERRSMWSGMTLVLTIFNLGIVFLDSLIILNAKLPQHHKLMGQIVIWIMLIILILILLFILTLIVMFIYNGVVILFKEGTRLSNFLSLAMGIAILLLLFVYPSLDKYVKGPWFRYLYLFVSLTIFYILGMLMMYTLTSFINLINWGKNKLDYVVVLGAGLINGEKVSPLLASRINRGIEIYKKNPGSKIIMSGGQGEDEKLPEGQAMAEYAISEGMTEDDIIIENKSLNTNQNLAYSYKLMRPNSRFAIVSNSYHVYRALVLAKRQGLQCIGYGAKTKWYFTLNAFVREFIAYIVITKKLQTTIISIIAFFVLALAGIYYFIH